MAGDPWGRQSAKRCSVPGCKGSACFGYRTPIYGKAGHIVWMCLEHRGIIEAELASRALRRYHTRTPDAADGAGSPARGPEPRRPVQGTL